MASSSPRLATPRVPDDLDFDFVADFGGALDSGIAPPRNEEGGPVRSVSEDFFGSSGGGDCAAVSNFCSIVGSGVGACGVSLAIEGCGVSAIVGGSKNEDA